MLPLTVTVNDDPRATFTLREDAEHFVDQVCEEASLGTDIKLIVTHTGEVLAHWDRNGDKVI